MAKTAGGNVLKVSVQEEPVLARLEFDTNNVSDPTVASTLDQSGFFNTVVRVSQGVFDVNVTDDWANIKMVSAQAESATFYHIQPVSYTLTAGAQKFRITQLDAAGAVVDSTGVHVVLQVMLYRR